MKPVIKEYRKEDIAVVWDSAKCSKSTICVFGLPQVFRPLDRPWIQTNCATRQQIIDQVSQCPSGALRIKYYGDEQNP